MGTFWKDMKYNIMRTMKSDPAATSAWMVIWTYPHIKALFWHHIAHSLYLHGHRILARRVALHSRHVTGIEIHPGATIGRGLFIDHGMGVVIGETAIVGEDVTLFHGVTLGGMSSRAVKRHPTVGNNVLIGAGTKVLGDITVGDRSKIGCNLVIKRDVPEDVIIYETEPEHVVRRQHKPDVHVVGGTRVHRPRVAFVPEDMTEDMAWYI